MAAKWQVRCHPNSQGTANPFCFSSEECEMHGITAHTALEDFSSHNSLETDNIH